MNEYYLILLLLFQVQRCIKKLMKLTLVSTDNPEIQDFMIDSNFRVYFGFGEPYSKIRLSS